MKEKARTLKQSLPAIARAVTKQKGIKIVFEGPPRTDGRTIYSNPLPITASPEQVKICVGDIDHECGHVLYTDFAAFQSVTKGENHKTTPLLLGLTNAVEDTFIERRTGERYLGCRETLRESVELMDRDVKLDPNMISPARALGGYVDCFGRMEVLGQNVQKSMAAYKPLTEALLGEAGMVRLNGLLATYLPKVNSTQDSIGLAGMVIKLLKELKEEEERKREQQQQQQQQQQQSAESSAQNGGKGSDDGSTSLGAGDSKDTAGPGGPAGEDKPGKEAGKGSGTGPDSSNRSQSPGTDGSAPNATGSEQCPGQSQGQGQGQEQPGSGNLGDSSSGSSGSSDTGADGAGTGVTQILDDQSADTSPVFDRVKAMEEAMGQAAVGVFTPGSIPVKYGTRGGSISEYHRPKSDLTGAIARLQRDIVSEYQTLTRSRHVVAEEGRIDGRRVHLALQGEPRIFRNRTRRALPFPAVSIVVDRSSSMSKGERMTLAKQALIAVAEVNECIAVKTEIVTFGGTTVEIVKSFDESLVACRPAIGVIDGAGGTPTANALWVAANRIAARREARKIVLLITDGEPNNLRDAKQVADMIYASGIELYGIGIEIEMIRNFCRLWKVIKSAAEIPTAVLSAMRERMLRVA